MDYSNWLSSSSLDVRHSNTNHNETTLRLLDDSPVRDSVHNAVEQQQQQPDLHTNHLLTTSNNNNHRLWVKDEAGELMEELNKVKAENKKLTEMLAMLCEKYNDLQRQLADCMGKTASSEMCNNNNNNNNSTKKRKLENSNNNVQAYNNGIASNTNNNNNLESSSSDEEDSIEKPKEETLKAKITTVAVRTEASDSTLIFKDGYQWRKYGQKVTRDNPCPRAYFKCSFAPSCPVKKKVQRSLEDQALLVATYEGDHNHAAPSQQETNSNSTRFNLGSVPTSNTTLGSTGSGSTITLDLTKPKMVNNNNNNNVTTGITKSMSNTANNQITPSQITKFNSPEFQKFLAEQMASSLTKDPNFTAALAAAISGKFIPQNSSE